MNSYLCLEFELSVLLLVWRIFGKYIYFNVFIFIYVIFGCFVIFLSLDFFIFRIEEIIRICLGFLKIGVKKVVSISLD